jgi:hypothetical protein
MSTRGKWRFLWVFLSLRIFFWNLSKLKWPYKSVNFFIKFNLLHKIFPCRRWIYSTFEFSVFDFFTGWLPFFLTITSNQHHVILFLWREQTWVSMTHTVCHTAWVILYEARLKFWWVLQQNYCFINAQNDIQDRNPVRKCWELLVIWHEIDFKSFSRSYSRRFGYKKIRKNVKVHTSPSKTIL